MTLERGNLLNNRYRVVEILGQGGMGSVYRAVDENLGVDVAVKENLFTTDEYARQFRLEAVILANLRHPNLPRVTDHFVLEGQGQYLVMDYIEGEDLRQRMERSGTLPDSEVIIVGAAMCDALGYLHSRKPPILHRDIKPGNVKITPEGEVFLVDFGLAKVIQGSQVTTTGARAMTPGYSPPEQYGTARTDPRTDIYSLGATLYATLTGVIPEDGLARAMDNADLTPVRKRNPKVARRLAAAIEKSMAVDSDDRFQTAADFKKALLASSSKTQRLNGDYIVEPAPEENDAPSIEAPAAEGAITGVPLVPAESLESDSGKPKATQRKKRRQSRWKFIRFLLLLILIAGSIAAAAFYYPRLTQFMTPFAPIDVATETPLATPTLVAAIAQETATHTPEPTPTHTPRPTFTATPTFTPTATSTPLGGGVGQIAFVSDRTGVPQIYLSNLDSGSVWPITNFPEGACQPEWSPDGTQLVFVSPCAYGEDILQGSSLYLSNVDGMELNQIASAPGGDFEPAWSPDGTHIAFTSLRDGHMQIYSLNLADDSVARLTETSSDVYTRYPSWSPFGNQIVYAARRYGAYQIWTMTDTGQAEQRLTVSGYEVFDIMPVWSPDGSLILYSQYPISAPSRVRLMSIRYEDRGQAGVPTDFGPLPIKDVDYSADGFWLVFEGADEEGNQDIYIMTVAGASRTRLTTDPGNDFDPVWRPAP